MTFRIAEVIVHETPANSSASSVAGQELRLRFLNLGQPPFATERGARTWLARAGAVGEYLILPVTLISPVEMPGTVRKRQCNMHDDCDAADERARKAGRFGGTHCHDDCCEDCFGC